MLKKIRSMVCFLVCLLTVVFIPLLKQIHQNEVGAIDMTRLMWLGAGAGSKGIVGGMVKGFAPQAGITPDIAAAAIGFWLAQQGGNRMGPFGEGMLIAAIGQLVRQPMEGIFGQIGNPPAPTPEAAIATKTNTQGSPEESTDAYLTAKYGIT